MVRPLSWSGKIRGKGAASFKPVASKSNQFPPCSPSTTRPGAVSQSACQKLSSLLPPFKILDRRVVLSRPNFTVSHLWKIRD